MHTHVMDYIHTRTYMHAHAHTHTRGYKHMAVFVHVHLDSGNMSKHTKTILLCSILIIFLIESNSLRFTT